MRRLRLAWRILWAIPMVIFALLSCACAIVGAFDYDEAEKMFDRISGT